MTHFSSSPDTYFVICIAVCVALLLIAVFVGRKKPRIRWLCVAAACLALLLPAFHYQTLAIDETELTLTHGVGPLARTTRIPFDGWVLLEKKERYDSKGRRTSVWWAAYRDGEGIGFRTHLLRPATLDLLRTRGIRVEP